MLLDEYRKVAGDVAHHIHYWYTCSVHLLDDMHRRDANSADEERGLLFNDDIDEFVELTYAMLAEFTGIVQFCAPLV